MRLVHGAIFVVESDVHGRDRERDAHEVLLAVPAVNDRHDVAGVNVGAEEQMLAVVEDESRSLDAARAAACDRGRLEDGDAVAEPRQRHRGRAPRPARPDDRGLHRRYVNCGRR